MNGSGWTRRSGSAQLPLCTKVASGHMTAEHHDLSDRLIKRYDGSDYEEAPKQALACASVPSPASSSKRDATDKDGNGVPIVADTRPKKGTKKCSTTPVLSADTGPSKQSPAQATTIDEDREKAELGNGHQKRLRRANKKLTCAMVKLKEAQQEICSLMEIALPAFNIRSPHACLEDRKLLRIVVKLIMVS